MTGIRGLRSAVRGPSFGPGYFDPSGSLEGSGVIRTLVVQQEGKEFRRRAPMRGLAEYRSADCGSRTTDCGQRSARPLRPGRNGGPGDFGLAIMTSVDLITATAASPRRSFSARTASEVITAVND